MRYAVILALALGSTGAFADEVHLRNGGRLVGEIRERRPDAVVVEIGPGVVTVPMAQVARVVTTASSALSTYRARAARLSAEDAEGWFELALWARDQGLNTQARQALDHVLALNPNHSGAHQAAGHVSHGGRWMTAEDSYRARGFVPFEGSWVDPADRDAILTERAASAEESRLRSESDARVREADARARAAEAEARRAEAESQIPDNGGIPYPWVLGGGGGTVIVVDDDDHSSPSHRKRRRHRPPSVDPVKRPPPRDGGSQPQDRPARPTPWGAEQRNER